MSHVTVIFKTACGATRAETWPRESLRNRWIVPLMPTRTRFEPDDGRGDMVPPEKRTREFVLWRLEGDTALYREDVP